MGWNPYPISFSRCSLSRSIGAFSRFQFAELRSLEIVRLLQPTRLGLTTKKVDYCQSHLKAISNQLRAPKRARLKILGCNKSKSEVEYSTSTDRIRSVTRFLGNESNLSFNRRC